jgi:structural maintenance of chromosome 4
MSRKKLNDELKDLNKKIKQLDLKISKIKVEISSFDNTRNDLTTFIPQLRKQCSLSAEDSAQLVELNKEVQKCRSDMKSCSAMASKLETEVANLQKAILDAGGSDMKNQQAICENAIKDLNNAEKLLASAKVAVTTNNKNAAKAKKILEISRKELDECGSSLDKKNEALSLLEQDAKAVKESFTEVQKIEEERRAILEEASKECDELKKSMAEIKCKEIELLGQSDALTKQLLDSEKCYEKWEKELHNLRSIANEDDESDNISEVGNDDTFEDSSDNNPNSSNSLDGEDVTMQEVKVDDKQASVQGNSSLPVLPCTALEKYDVQEIMNAIGILESERNTIAKNANMGAIAEYRKKEADYLARVDELDNVTEQRNEARKKHEDLRRQRLEMFMEGFGQITLRLKEMYQMITLGGDA